MTPRQICIKAMANAEWPWEADAVIGANWRTAGVHRVKTEIATAALDAFLTALTRHADKFEPMSWRIAIEDLIDVLEKP